MASFAIQPYLQDAIAASRATKRTAQLSARAFQLLSRSNGASRTNNRTFKTSQIQLRNAERVPSSSPPRIGRWKPNEPNDLPTVVKGCMRSVRYPVFIVTSSDLAVATDGDPNSWRGLTIASFNTVSMDPQPMVSFNIHQDSSTLKAIQSSGYFTIHALSQNRLGTFLAQQFARPHTPHNFINPINGDPAHWVRGNKYSKASKKVRPGFDPRIFPPRLQILDKNGEMAVLFTLLCHHDTDLVSAGDHRIVVGRVVHATHGRAEAPNRVMAQLREEEATGYRGMSLGYHNGRYDARPSRTTFRSVVRDTLDLDPAQDWARAVKGYRALKRLGETRPVGQEEGSNGKEHDSKSQQRLMGEEENTKQDKGITQPPVPVMTDQKAAKEDTHVMQSQIRGEQEAMTKNL